MAPKISRAMIQIMNPQDPAVSVKTHRKTRQHSELVDAIDKTTNHRECTKLLNESTAAERALLKGVIVGFLGTFRVNNKPLKYAFFGLKYDSKSRPRGVHVIAPVSGSVAMADVQALNLDINFARALTSKIPDHDVGSHTRVEISTVDNGKCARLNRMKAAILANI